MTARTRSGLAVVVLLVGLVAAGCGAGPDFEAQFFNVGVKNDLARTATLTYCDGTSCTGQTFHITAGSTAKVSFSGARVVTTLRVSSGGHRLGCVTRTFHAKVPTHVIHLSRLSPCP